MSFAHRLGLNTLPFTARPLDFDSARQRLAAYLKWLEDKARRRREYERYLAALAAQRKAGDKYSEQVGTGTAAWVGPNDVFFFCIRSGIDQNDPWLNVVANPESTQNDRGASLNFQYIDGPQLSCSISERLHKSDRVFFNTSSVVPRSSSVRKLISAYIYPPSLRENGRSPTSQS